MNFNFSESKPNSLVDQIENYIIEYIKINNLRAGDTLPKELDLAQKFGVARGVLREALSRLKMLGIIESRTNRGIVIAEPNLFIGLEKVAYPNLISDDTLLSLLEFRIALEIGMCESLCENVTDKDIDELADLVKLGGILENNEYELHTELHFHFKLYSITKNKLIIDFQKIIRPLIIFVKDKFEDYFKPINIELSKNNQVITHQDILTALKTKNYMELRAAMEGHFAVYREFIRQYKTRQNQ
jgi:GntR family transcriptional repressor for pyruvate dehydrogenase complex